MDEARKCMGNFENPARSPGLPWVKHVDLAPLELDLKRASGVQLPTVVLHRIASIPTFLRRDTVADWWKRNGKASGLYKFVGEGRARALSNVRIRPGASFLKRFSLQHVSAL